MLWKTMTPALSIQPEAPDSADARALITALDAHLGALYRPENRHGLSAAALRQPSVTFLVARGGGVAVGCGAVLFVPGEYAEVKRMFVTPAWRGRGVAQALLARLEGLARRQGFGLLRLETGIYQAEAVRLYERAGFARRAAFGPYRDDGVSLCYEKALAPAAPVDDAPEA